MGLPRKAYIFLFLWPLMIMGLTLSLQAPNLTSSELGPVNYQSLQDQLYQQYSQLADLKLIYGRLAQNKQRELEPQLESIHQLYEKAVSQLQEFEKAAQNSRLIRTRLFLEIGEKIGESQSLLAQKIHKILESPRNFYLYLRK